MLFGLDMRVVDLNLACFSRLGRGLDLLISDGLGLALYRWFAT